MRIIAALAAAFVALAAGAASAATVTVADAWIPAPPAGAPTAVGYGAITNHGLSDRLMGGQSRASASVEVHQMSTAGEIMRMRAVTGGLAIGASATVKLSPNGYHLMLVGLKAPLKAGQHVKVVLHFQRAGDVAVDFPVKAPQPAGGMRM